MFSKSRIHEKAPKAEPARAPQVAQPASGRGPVEADTGPVASTGFGAAPKSKPAASILASDLTVTGNLRTTGDIVIEGVVDGDIRAHLLTVGESATIRGEIVADDIVINGRVIGRVRGLKVRLTSTARVEGDIIHKTIAIESGAHFEGSVQRQDDPLGASSGGKGSAKPPMPGGKPLSQGMPGGTDHAAAQRSPGAAPAPASAPAAASSKTAAKQAD